MLNVPGVEVVPGTGGKKAGVYLQELVPDYSDVVLGAAPMSIHIVMADPEVCTSRITCNQHQPEASAILL